MEFNRIDQASRSAE